MDRQEIHIKEIKELAKKFTAEQLEGCISQQIQKGDNICLRGVQTEEVINELSKAEFVRDLMDRGMSMSDAVRELARRIRLVQMAFSNDN